LAFAVLVPFLGLAAVCQSSSASAPDTMACCRNMHNACMRGPQSGHGNCCRQSVAARIPVASLTSRAAGVIPGSQTVASQAAIPGCDATVLVAECTLEPDISPPRSSPLYEINSSLLI